ncbi:MAG: hypothetical protein ABW168_23110 [Sedimenticola sp.]
MNGSHIETLERIRQFLDGAAVMELCIGSTVLISLGGCRQVHAAAEKKIALLGTAPDFAPS